MCSDTIPVMELDVCSSSSSTPTSVLSIKHRDRSISPIPNNLIKFHTYKYKYKYSTEDGNGRPSSLTATAPTMLSNGYVGRGSTSSSSSQNQIYRRQDSCLLIPPPNAKKPRAIIKFLGGAFIGAVPELTYRSIISFPYFVFLFYFILFSCCLQSTAT